MHDPDNRLPARLIPLPHQTPDEVHDLNLPTSASGLSQSPDEFLDPNPPASASAPSPDANLAPPKPAPRRSTRTRRKPDRFGHGVSSVSSSLAPDIPKTWRQLLRSPQRDAWLKAADKELSSLVDMSTWKLVPRPAKRRIIRSKWVFKPKLRPDGTVSRLKARLVAMGFFQQRGVDFNEVFAPTT